MVSLPAVVMHEVENEQATQGILAAIKYLEKNTGEGVTLGSQVFIPLQKGELVHGIDNDTRSDKIKDKNNMGGDESTAILDLQPCHNVMK